MAVIVPMSLPIYACFDSSTTFRLLLPFTSSPSSSSSSSSSSSCRRCVVGPHLAMRRRRPRLFPAPVRAAAGDPPVPAQENKDGVRMASDIQTLLRRFWKVAAPYWSSEDKVQARLRLGAVFALTLATTGISVGFNFLGRDFYNALANKDQEQFTRQLLYYLGGFAVGIPFFVLRDYAREVLSLRWRSWMTSYYMKRYFKNRTFYQIQSQSIIDNPDQRIVDDLSAFTGTALAFSLTLFNAAVDLISFSNILFGIYPPLFVVLFVYSIGGTAVSVYLGKDLVTLNFMQEKKEADFRYGLVRVRENAESIAFYGGEGNEIQLLLQRFASAFENLSQLLVSSRNLEFFTNGYRYLIQILPAAVVAPMYFSGKIEFGVINQSVSAFNHILSDFSLIVYQFQSISAFSAVIDRLGEFDDVLDNSIPTPVSSHEQNISILFTNSSSWESNGSVFVNNKLLEIENLTLQTPKSKRVLIDELSFVLDHRDHLLITGPSGSGKTSLLRAMAGLWRFGKGRIAFYINEGKDISDEDLKGCNGRRASDIFFLPQKPYMVLGTLRQQLLYPMWIDEITANPQSSGTLPFFSQAQLLGKLTKPATANLEQVLKDVRLGDIVSRFNGFDSVYEWSSVLSLGEQQRLAFARLLLAKPKLVLLDESTSALDEANEAHLYKLIADAGITYISIGHRQTLFNYHNKTLRIFMVDSEEGRKRNWQVEPIYQPDAREINTLK